MPLTCGARSTVNVDQLSVNTDWVSNGLRWASGWAGLGRTRGKLWRCHVTAVGLYWASSTARGRGRGSRWTRWCWSMDLRQGPWWTKSTVISLGSALVHRVQGCAAQLAPPPLFLPRRAPPATYSPASFRSGASAQLAWGKAPSGFGDCDGGVGATARTP